MIDPGPSAQTMGPFKGRRNAQGRYVALGASVGDDGDAGNGGGSLTFIPADADISVSGTLDEGGDILIQDAQNRFGVKLTQHPYIYDLADRGVWVNGEKQAHDLIQNGDPVPEKFFSSKGGTPRFLAPPEPIGPGRNSVYGGDFGPDAGDGSNMTLRMPLPEQELPETVSPERPNYYSSARWYTSFPWSKFSGSCKFFRIWGLKDTSDFGRLRFSFSRQNPSNDGGLMETDSTSVLDSSSLQGLEALKWHHLEADFDYRDGGALKTYVNGGFWSNVAINNVGVGPNGPWSGGIWVRQWGFDPTQSQTGVEAGDMGYFADLYTDASPAKIVLTNSEADPFTGQSRENVAQMHTAWEAGEVQVRELYSSVLGTPSGKHLWAMTENRDTVYLGKFEESA